MAIRIGQIELNGVQSVHTEESRVLVEQHLPLQDGSVFQDLGSKPLVVVVDGLLLGAAALAGIERLRAARIAAEPLPFAADMLAGSELSEVLIDDLQVRQIAGYADRYRYALRLREYKRLPASSERLQQRINADVAGVAEAWADDSLAAASVLLEPARLPETLRQRPQVLDHLSGADLGQSILLHAERLTGGSFGSVLQAVGRIDLAKANALVEVLRDGDGLPDLLQKCLDEGVGLLGELSGLDLGRAAPLIDALRDGFAFLKLLREVAHSAAELVERLDGFDPFAPLGSPAGDSP